MPDHKLKNERLNGKVVRTSDVECYQEVAFPLAIFGCIHWMFFHGAPAKLKDGCITHSPEFWLLVFKPINRHSHVDRRRNAKFFNSNVLFESGSMDLHIGKAQVWFPEHLPS